MVIITAFQAEDDSSILLSRSFIVAQWLLEHPNQDWNNSYLIYLYADLDKWRVRLDLTNKDYSTFREPDLNNQLTAIALQDDGRMFKKLKLVGNY